MNLRISQFSACLLLLTSLLALAVKSSAQSEAEASKQYSRKGADTCLSCHEDATTLAIFSTSHAVPTNDRSPFGHGQLQCEACHGPGDAHSGRVRRGEVRPPVIRFSAADAAPVEQQNSVCLTCHTSDVGLAWHAGAHEFSEVACSDCHRSHARVDPVADVSLQTNVCAACHIAEHNETKKAFAHPLAENKMTCTACHGMHTEHVASDLAQATVNDTCYQCHADKRGPYLWEHAPVSEDCGLCHEPHGSNNPGMLSRRPPLMCQGCHSEQGHPDVAYGTDGLASNSASPYLLAQGCLNCHSQVHGSNHPSGSKLMR